MFKFYILKNKFFYLFFLEMEWIISFLWRSMMWLDRRIYFWFEE